MSRRVSLFALLNITVDVWAKDAWFLFHDI